VGVADPAPGAVGLGAPEPVHADAEQPVADRSAVEGGVEARYVDAVEVDVAECLVMREIGQPREQADVVRTEYRHARSND
jgi:hypothetical protein